MMLDTNAISALADGNQNITTVLDKATTAAVPYVAYAEFRYGLLGSTRPKAGLQLLTQLQAALPLIFPDPDTLEIYADIKDGLKRRGLKIPDNDLWIAALAQEHDMPVLTRDRHFDHIPGIRRIDW